MSEFLHDSEVDRRGVVLAGEDIAAEAHFEEGEQPVLADERALEQSVTPAISPVRRAVRRFVHNPIGMVAFGYLVLMLLVAIFGDLIMPHDPNQQAFAPFLGPSSDHWLGTDDLGRDLASRLIDGASVSVRAGYQTVAMALVVAVPIGLIAGYLGGHIDNVLLRVMDAVNSFPALILALVIAAILGPGLSNAMLAITIVLIPGFVRIIRGSTLAVTQETFVEASRSIGTPIHVILRKRILPSVLSPLIVAVTLILGIALIAEAALSFLGLGTQPPDASWGNMLRRGYTYIFSEPYQMIPPGVAIALAVLSFNMVGDSLRDALGLAEFRPPKGSGKRRLGMTVVAERKRAKGNGGDGDRPATTTTAPVVHHAAAPAADPVAPLLSVRDLQVQFTTHAGPVTVVDGVSFDVARGEVVGLVGESGSGKTVTSLSIMRLLTSPPARITQGQILFGGKDLLTLPFKAMKDARGDAMSMVFQDPMSSLNPAFTIGNQLVEAIRLHRDTSRDQARKRAKELLDLVGIPDAEARLKEYPHRLSGGMRQRVLIAIALANEPELLIADEPTTALDVTVQAQILDLMRSLQQELGMAMIFVTHDLGVIADIADRVIVMYAGQLVERAAVHDLFANPRHPYTQKLLAAIPQATPRGERLAFIPGVVPVPGHWAKGCRFSPRCDFATDVCRAEPIQLTNVGARGEVRCVRHAELTLSARS
jgi:peptide/nickel transport system permease protein